MGNRYWITGVQLGMLMGLAKSIEMQNLLDSIAEDQYLCEAEQLTNLNPQTKPYNDGESLHVANESTSLIKPVKVKDKTGDTNSTKNEQSFENKIMEKVIPDTLSYAKGYVNTIDESTGKPYKDRTFDEVNGISIGEVRQIIKETIRDINQDKGENSETVMKQLNETVQDKSELELYEQIQQKEEELKELREKANHWTMQDISQGKVVPKSGITITNVKVVGFCSKCRKKYDAITRYKDGSIVPDEDINCINNAFGKCKKADKSEQEV